MLGQELGPPAHDGGLPAAARSRSSSSATSASELDGRGLAWRLGVLLGAAVLALDRALLHRVARARASRSLLAYGLVPATRDRDCAALVRPLARRGSRSPRSSRARSSYYAADRASSRTRSTTREPSTATCSNFVRADAPDRDRRRDVRERSRPTSAARRRARRVPRPADAADRRPGSRSGVRRSPSPASCSPRSAVAALAHARHRSSWSRATIGRGCPGALVRLPLFDNVLPVRFAAYTSLAAAVIVALWTAPAPRTGAAGVLPALAVAALVPAVWHADYRTVPSAGRSSPTGSTRPAFRAGRERRDLPLRLLGQLDALAGRERLLVPDGGGLPPRPSRRRRSSPTRPSTMLTFTTDNPKPPQILAFARHKQVDRIVSVAHLPASEQQPDAPLRRRSDSTAVSSSPRLRLSVAADGRAHRPPPHPATK